jgi:chemotaxis receptor (MCP) glutamine deamidase CheD
MAIHWLDQARVPVATLDVGGNQARRVEFSIADGVATVRRLGGA